jgi:hypothetical protein
VGHHQAPRPGPVTYYCLYVTVDIFRRSVSGWMLAHAENARLAEARLADTVARGTSNTASSPSTPTTDRP